MIVRNSRLDPGVHGLGDAQNTTHYRYAGAMFNREGRGFQGFRTVIEENLAAGLRTQSDFHQVFPLAGKLYKQRTWTLSEASNDQSFEQTQAITENETHWQFWPSTNKGGGYDETIAVPTESWTVDNNQPYFVGPDLNVSITRKLDANYRDELYQNSQSTVFDAWGNVEQVTTSYSEPNSQHRIVSTSSRDYTNTTSSWWLGRLDEETITKNPISSRSGVSIAANTDNTHTLTTLYSSWDSNARKPKNITVTPSTGKTSTSVLAYNTYGLVSSQKMSSAGETTRTTLTGYTSDGYFADIQTNSLSHSVESDMDERFGVPNWIDDANDQRELFTYDAFGRLTSAHSVGRAPRAYTSLQWCNGCGVNDAVIIQTTEQSGSPSQVAYLDKLGRNLRSETEAFADNEKLVQVLAFNALGQTTFESVPEYDVASDLGTHYLNYDLLGRLTEKKTDQTDGQDLYTTYTHEQGSRGFTTEIDAGGLDMSRTYNGLNQLIETVDAKGGVTRYAYDSAGNPIVMEDANGHAITSRYNALGQKEWVNDPNMGLKQFTYTGFGEVHTEKDANNQTLTYTYDVLGRLKTRHFGNSLESQWSYDPTNGLGFVSSESRAGLASGQSFSKTHKYDSKSRPESQTTVIDGQSFLTKTQYDTNYGRPKGLQYPNGLTLAYGYNDRGYPTTVSNAASGYVYRTIESLDKSGQWDSAQSANGLLNTNKYFDEATGQHRAIYFNNMLSELHGSDYAAFDQFGNLEEVISTNASGSTEDENLFYDDLHRLTRSQRSNGATINYTYNAVGSITKKDDYASVYHYTGSKPNAVSSVSLKSGGSLSFGYDNNGNRTHENGTRVITYNAFNKPTNITRKGANIDFYYGADIMRYKQVNNTAGRTTLYVDKLFEKITEAGKTKYRYFIEDIAVLTQSVNSSKDSFEIGFTHRDRLGSTVAIADHNGILKETYSFDPFGKPRLGSGADKPTPILGSAHTTRGFTDHEHLDDVQLIHMNGRGYDYNLGAFLSVDPYIQSPTNSQSLNPYSYIMNNPLSGTDPTGYTAMDVERIEKIVRIPTKTGSRIPGRVTVSVTTNGDNSQSVSLSGGSAGARAAVKNQIVKGLAASERSNVQGAGSTSRQNELDLTAGKSKKSKLPVGTTPKAGTGKFITHKKPDEYTTDPSLTEMMVNKLNQLPQHNGILENTTTIIRNEDGSLSFTKNVVQGDYDENTGVIESKVTIRRGITQAIGHDHGASADPGIGPRDREAPREVGIPSYIQTKKQDIYIVEPKQQKKNGKYKVRKRKVWDFEKQKK